jgi:hypothetical protein
MKELSKEIESLTDTAIVAIFSQSHYLWEFISLLIGN